MPIPLPIPNMCSAVAHNSTCFRIFSLSTNPATGRLDGNSVTVVDSLANTLSRLVQVGTARVSQATVLATVVVRTARIASRTCVRYCFSVDKPGGNNSEVELTVGTSVGADSTDFFIDIAGQRFPQHWPDCLVAKRGTTAVPDRVLCS